MVVFTPQEANVDTIFNLPYLEALTVANFSPVLPPEIKAKQTILLFRVNNIIRDNTPETIKKEIERHNDFTKNTVTSVYKFPNNNIIKVTFSQAAVAQKPVASGLKMFYMSVAAHDIEHEDYIPITTSLRCLAIESHTTINCPKDKNYTI